MAGIGIAMGGIIHGVAIDAHGIQVNAPLLQQGGKGHKTKSQPAVKEALEAFDSIEIDVADADIFIEQLDAEQCLLEYSLSDSRNIRKEVTDGKLVLKQEEDHFFGFFVLGIAVTENAQNDYVKISLPKDVKCKDIVLNTDSGDVICKNIHADRLKMKADSADALLQNVNAQQMELHLESGKLKMEQVQGESCMITGDYGDIDGVHIDLADAQIRLEGGGCRLNDVLLETCDMRVDYGDVELELRKDPADYSYDLNAEYGNIKIAGEKMGESYRSFEKNPDCQIVIVCESGDIRIQ